MGNRLSLSADTAYNIIIDGPGFRNAFYAGVLKAFQEKNIALPKNILTWSGGVPIAVAYLLGMDMQEIWKWSISEFPEGMPNPQKINKMYSSFCDWIYNGRNGRAGLTEEQVAEKLAPLKVLATRSEGLLGLLGSQGHIFENFTGNREELMGAMIASAGIPGITQSFGESMIDGQFAQTFGDLVPEQFIIDGMEGGIPRVTLSVSKRIGSTIFHAEEKSSFQADKTSTLQKFGSSGSLSFSKETSKLLYEDGHKTGLQYLEDKQNS